MQQKLREISMLSRRKVGAARYLQPDKGKGKAIIDFKSSSSFVELKEKDPQYYSELE